MRTARNHQTHFCITQQLHGATQPFWNAHRRDRHSVKLLIASNVDYLLAKRRWGVEYTDVSLDRIYEYYNQITDDEVGEACAHLAGKALACREASPEDMIKAMRCIVLSGE